MGRTYAIPFETAAQRKTIFELLRRYNAHVPFTPTAEYVRFDANERFEQLCTGAPFHTASVANLKPECVCSSPSDGPALPRVVLVQQASSTGDDGDDGRAATTDYMRWQLTRAFHTVYVAGEFAIDMYQVNAKVHKRIDQDSCKRVERKRIWPSEADAAAAEPQAVTYTTAYLCDNPAWLAMLQGLDKATLKARILAERTVPPRLVAYGSTQDATLAQDEDEASGTLHPNAAAAKEVAVAQAEGYHAPPNLLDSDSDA